MQGSYVDLPKLWYHTDNVCKLYSASLALFSLKLNPGIAVYQAAGRNLKSYCMKNECCQVFYVYFPSNNLGFQDWIVTTQAS